MASNTPEDTELKKIFAHFFIMRGTETIPDRYWNKAQDDPEHRLTGELLAWRDRAVEGASLTARIDEINQAITAYESQHPDEDGVLLAIINDLKRRRKRLESLLKEDKHHL